MCTTLTTPEHVVHTKVLKSRTTYWLPRLSQSKQLRFSGFRWLSLRILLYLYVQDQGQDQNWRWSYVWCLMAVLRSGAGGVGGGCAVEGGLVFGLGGSGCRWAEVGLGGGLLARAYFSSSFLFDILGAGASGPGADTRIGVRIA